MSDSQTKPTSQDSLEERVAFVQQRLAVLYSVTEAQSQGRNDLPTCLDEPGGKYDSGERFTNTLAAGMNDLLFECMEKLTPISQAPFPVTEWRPDDGPDKLRERVTRTAKVSAGG